MRHFIFYGLDPHGTVLAREDIDAELDDARALAMLRLRDFPRVELWEDGICVLRERRRD